MTVAAALHAAKAARIAGLDCVEEWHWLGNNHAVHTWKLPRALQAGDLVLFQYSSAGNAFIRTVIGSTWDHVGMILGGGRRSLYLLEATMDGVTTYPLLRQLERYLTMCKKISVRLLNVPRTPQMERRLDRFTRKADGRPYGISPGKLLSSAKQDESQKGTDPSAERERQQARQHQEAYFCSELIIDAYRAMQLVDEGYNGGYFWPRAFGSGGELEGILNDGATLGPEIEADCCLFDELFRTCSRSTYHTVRRGGPDFPVVSKRTPKASRASQAQP